MNAPFALAAGVSLAVVAGVGTAFAGQHGGHMLYRPPHALPPVAGTIHMHPGAFGRGGHPGFAETGRGPGGFAHDQGFRRFRQAGPGYGPPMGYQGHALAQLGAGGYGQGGGIRPGFERRPYNRGYYGAGSGLLGAVGAGAIGYNLADSAVAGSTYGLTGSGYGYGAGYGGTAGYGYGGAMGYGYGVGSGSPVAEAPVQVSYGEPSLWQGGGAGYYHAGYAETGSPGRVPYYNSGYANPAGGLGAYSSGAFSPGPKIIVISQQNIARPQAQGCTCGPRVIHVHPRYRYPAW